MTPFENCDLVLLHNFYPPQACNDYLSTLLSSVNWSDDYYMAFGRRIDIPRLQAWYADPGISYSYSNNLLPTQTWTTPLSEIKQHVEQETGRKYNAVLLTYYRDGCDSVSWHADDDKELGYFPYIASLSLGASRELYYRHKHGQAHGSITLHNGDLLFMRPGFQSDWEHCVPAQPQVREARINLTFRLVSPVTAPALPDPVAPPVSLP